MQYVDANRYKVRGHKAYVFDSGVTLLYAGSRKKALPPGRVDEAKKVRMFQQAHNAKMWELSGAGHFKDCDCPKCGKG